MNPPNDTSPRWQRSEEIREILGRKPRTLVHWGNALLAVLLVAFFVADALVYFPEIRTFPLTLSDARTALIKVPAAEVAKLTPCRRLWVTMDLYPAEAFGRTGARVVRTGAVPEAHVYTVALTLDDTTESGRRLRLMKGMEGSAALMVSERGFLRNLMNTVNR